MPRRTRKRLFAVIHQPNGEAVPASRASVQMKRVYKDLYFVTSDPFPIGTNEVGTTIKVVDKDGTEYFAFPCSIPIAAGNELATQIFLNAH